MLPVVGHYYAIATVVVGEIGYLLALNWDWIGGATGIAPLRPFGRRSWPTGFASTSCQSLRRADVRAVAGWLPG
jgi:ABC-type branched-subunit amino acid transport system permease subunit